jgi:hypothetical protein
LPAYFDALNESCRYQLTPIGAPMRDLHVAAEVSANTFEIGGGSPNGKVSWLITGVRHDASARHHPIIVEEDKPVQQRGKFLDPEAHGADGSKAIHPPPSLRAAR